MDAVLSHAMKEINCNICGETVYLPERGERIADDNLETKMKHFRENGHSALQPTEPPEWYVELNEDDA